MVLEDHEPLLSIKGIEKIGSVGFGTIYENDDEHNQSIFLEGNEDNTEGESSEADNQSVVEQRLGNVEHMLQALMNQISGPNPNSFHQHPQTSLIRAPPIRSSLVTSGTSMISALSNSDHVSVVQRQNDSRDNDKLMIEIEHLKRQLEIAKQTNTFAGGGAESESTTSSARIRSKKKRKRKLKKPWK